MSLRVEHIALAVADLDAAIAHYGAVWGLEVAHRERVEDQGVEEAMLPIGDSYLQLLGTTDPETTVGKFLAKRGPGLHHIGYAVDDVAEEAARLRSEGLTQVDLGDHVGAAFFYQKDVQGVLTELVPYQTPGARLHS